MKLTFTMKTIVLAHTIKIILKRIVHTRVSTYKNGTRANFILMLSEPRITWAC